jgi:hypothetical protein
MHAASVPHLDTNFDPRSGSWIERLLFNHRIAVLAVCVLVTLLLPQGTIYDAAYLDTLRKLSDEIVPDARAWTGCSMKSLWTPITRWVGVTEEGLEGGPVIPDGYDGSPASLQQLAANVARSGELGQLVARDSRSQRDLRAAAGPGQRGPGRWTTRSCRSGWSCCAAKYERRGFASTSPASPRSSVT